MGKSEVETSSIEQEVSEGEDKQEHPYTQDTPTGVSQLFGEHKDTDPESDSGESPDHTAKAVQGQHQGGQPKKYSSRSLSSEEEPPNDEALCNEARQKAKLLDTCFDA